MGLGDLLFGGSDEEPTHDHEWKAFGDRYTAGHGLVQQKADEDGYPYFHTLFNVFQRYECAVEGCNETKRETVDEREFVNYYTEVTDDD